MQLVTYIWQQCPVGDQELFFANALEQEGYTHICRIISEDLSEAAPDLIGKVLGTVYKLVSSHTKLKTVVFPLPLSLKHIK